MIVNRGKSGTFFEKREDNSLRPSFRPHFMIENKVKKELKTFHQGVVGFEFVGPHCVGCRFDDSAKDAVNICSLATVEFPNGSPNLISLGGSSGG